MNNKVRLKPPLQYLLTVALTISACTAMADNDSSQEKIAGCVACHGADGIGKADQYPNLQGQQIGYLVKQLKSYKSGVRKSSTMNTVAKSLSDEDIQMLAMFFNRVK